MLTNLRHVPHGDAAVAPVGEGAESDGEPLAGEAGADDAGVVVAGHDAARAHPAVVDGDDADDSGGVEEREDVAGAAVGAREFEIAARVREEDEALGVAQLHGLAAEAGQRGGGGVLLGAQGSASMYVKGNIK